MSKEKDLRELFHDTLKDIYFAENKDPRYAAQNGESRFRAGTEVDEVRWVTVDEAVDLLSYRRDRALLRAFDLEATA